MALLTEKVFLAVRVVWASRAGGLVKPKNALLMYSSCSTHGQQQYISGPKGYFGSKVQN